MFSYVQQVVSDIAHCCGRQSDYIISCDQQVVSDIAHFVKGSLMANISNDQQGVSDFAHFCEWQSYYMFPMTNRE